MTEGRFEPETICGSEPVYQFKPTWDDGTIGTKVCIRGKGGGDKSVKNKIGDFELIGSRARRVT